MRCVVHHGERVRDLVGERRGAGKRNEMQVARDRFGLVEEADVGLAGVDAREQVFFREDLRGVFDPRRESLFRRRRRRASSSPASCRRPSDRVSDRCGRSRCPAFAALAAPSSSRRRRSANKRRVFRIVRPADAEAGAGKRRGACDLRAEAEHEFGIDADEDVGRLRAGGDQVGEHLAAGALSLKVDAVRGERGL